MRNHSEQGEDRTLINSPAILSQLFSPYTNNTLVFSFLHTCKASSANNEKKATRERELRKFQAAARNNVLLKKMNF